MSSPEFIAWFALRYGPPPDEDALRAIDVEIDRLELKLYRTRQEWRIMVRLQAEWDAALDAWTHQKGAT